VAQSVTLTIRDDQSETDYVYGDDRLLVEVESKNKRVRGLDIEIEDMPMQIGPTADGDPEFLGINDPLAVPERTYRAKLEDASGNTVLDGAIVTSDATYDRKTKSWSVVLINQAPKDFWSLLKTEFVPFPERRSSLSITKTDVQVYEKKLTGKESYLSTTRTFYQPYSVLEFIFDELGIAFQMPPKLWEYQIDYESASRTVDSQNVRISLGTRNMRTLVEEITKMAGWRALIEYRSFPSKDLRVELRSTDWPLPTAQQALDSAEAEQSYAITIEPNNDNWALELRNGVDESSPNPISETYNSGPIPSFGVPAAYGAVAPQSWNTPPHESSERRLIADVVQTKFKVPPIAVENALDVQSNTEWVNIGPVRHVVDDSRLQKSDELLMFEVKQDPGDSKWYGVHSRRPAASEYNGDKTLGHTPAWASAAYKQQPLRRSSLRELEGDFIDIGEQTVGDPTVLVEMLSKQWHGQESRRDVAQLLTTLTLRRPVSIERNSAVGQIFNDGRSRWSIPQRSTSGQYRTLDRGSGKEDWILMHWERTPIAEAVELWYNVQIKDTRDSDPEWSLIAEVRAKTFSTATTHQYKSAGNGGASYSDGDIQARVRPVKGTESVSSGERPVEGAWNQFRITKA